MAHFLHEGHRIAYTEHGGGERPVVLIHGLLFNQKLMTPLARSLAAKGHRAITIDLLGHGASSRPDTTEAYSMTGFGEQVVGLLDHLGIERAVVGGLSLGANTALEAAVAAPDRIQGLVVEMPVLDRAILGCAIAFTPIMVGLTFGGPLVRAVAAAARRVPTPTGSTPDIALDWIRQDPAPSNAVFQGLFFHRIAPPSVLRRTITAPTLVIGHPNDPIHPFSDSDALVRELGDARLVEMGSILDARLKPRRYRDEIAAFLQDAWAAKDPEAVRRPSRPRPSARAAR